MIALPRPTHFLRSTAIPHLAPKPQVKPSSSWTRLYSQTPHPSAPKTNHPQFQARSRTQSNRRLAFALVGGLTTVSVILGTSSMIHLDSAKSPSTSGDGGNSSTPSSSSSKSIRDKLAKNSSPDSYVKKNEKAKAEKEKEAEEKDKENKNDQGYVMPNGQEMISAAEVAKHNSREDCWIIVEGNVYDVTDFLDEHPGGAGIILANAGKDATEIYKPLHPPNTIESNLSASQRLGPVDPSTLDHTPRPLTADEKRIRNAREEMPPLESMINLYDFEQLAEKVLSRTGWAYYRSAANGEDTYRENEEAWNRYWFRPRVLRSCLNIDPSTKILGIPSSLPIYVSPAAMAKLGHPLGEVNITRAAGNVGIIQGISANASCSLEEMVEAKKEGQELIFQVYLNKDRKASEKLLAKVEELGCSAIMFTVDSAVSGYRELDIRAKGVLEQAPPSAADDKNKSAAPAGIAQAISGYQDSNLVWEDINFIRKHTKLPIIVKGIQCVEDAEICAKYDVAAIILSNHGGRSLNFSPPPIDILYEMRQTKPELFDKMEVYVDGGIKRGTDVVKALCLGAKAVGLGRAVLYANGTYGQEGIEKMYELLYNEVVVAMAQLGAHTVADLVPEMVRPRGWLPGQK